VANYPVRVTARPDQPSRWLWLVKWLLLIPHYLVLVALWVAVVVLTVVAYIAVLFTGRYPRSFFHFNVGVLRWTWRVGYYGYWVLGTDRYPPFTLADVPDYPARLEIDGPPTPKRWLPLVAWLLAIPHILIVVALTSGLAWVTGDNNGGRAVANSLGVTAVAVLIAAFALLFTGRYPAGLHDLLVGAWRWFVRVISYLTLLTDRYPPFRLDVGDDEPTGGPEPTPPAGRVRLGTTGSVVALIAGVVLVLTGGGLSIGGGSLLALNGARGNDGFIATRTLTLSTATAAITAEDITIHPAHMGGRDVAALQAMRVTVTGDGGTPLFLGVARQSDVDAWLGGTAHDRLTGMYGMQRAQYRRDAGVVRAVAPPVDQTFWLDKASGTGTVALNWKPGDGRFALVLANADGSTGVVTDAVLAAKVPALRPLGAGLLTGGLLTLALAVVLIAVGAAGLGGPRTPTTPAPTPGPDSKVLAGTYHP
jgi:hypothetical protein